MSLPDLSGLRTLIVHEWLVARAGSERCVEELLVLLPEADLIAGLVSPSMRATTDLGRRARESRLRMLPGAHRYHRWTLPLHPLAFASIDTSGYDLVISSSHAFAKMVRPPPGVPHVCYCYSPPRYLWDLHGTYTRQGSLPARWALRALAAPLRAADVAGGRRVSHMLAISRAVADRIRRCYGRDADVIYPPVSPKPSAGDPRNTARGDFLLYLGRLVPYKRVDLAIGAARRLGMRLVVAGDGPELGRLRRVAGPGVEFTGPVSEADAGALLSTCRAFVFCAEEDFGMAPVEANAHGAPVVGFGQGGLLESQVEGVTAEFFAEQTVDAVSAALARALNRRWDDSRIRANALRFGPDRFRREFAEYLRAVLDRSP